MSLAEIEDLVPGLATKDWVSNSQKETPAAAGAAKPTIVMSEDSELSFVINIFKWQGTALAEIVPQLITVLGLTVVAQLIVYFYPSYELPPDAEAVHKILGSTLGFLVVFRSGQAYSNYVEGRKILGAICNNMREVTQVCHTFNAHKDADLDKVVILRKTIRRKLMLLYATMRQAVREQHDGFTPGCSIEDADFATNWHLDPAEPRIGDLMNEKEKVTIAACKVPARPALIQTQLNLLCTELANEMVHSDFFIDHFYRNLEDTMNLYKSAARICDTPVPMPYSHLLYSLIFIFTFITPFVYAPEVGSDMVDDWDNKFKWGSGWVASLLVCTAYYGIMETAAKLQNPFGYDLIDHDMETFGKKSHAECLTVAIASRSGDEVSYMN